jgi:septal ring factor EnvC (AmiA/AmiB activator)
MPSAKVTKEKITDKYTSRRTPIEKKEINWALWSVLLPFILAVIAGVYRFAIIEERMNSEIVQRKQHIEILEKQIEDLKKDLKENSKDIHKIDTKVSILESKKSI